MKKLVLSALAVVVCLGSAAILTACGSDDDDTCTCTEKKSGYVQELELTGYSSCSALQKALNKTADELGYNQNWSCK